MPSSASDRVISTLFLFTKKIITVDESTLIENNEKYGLNAVWQYHSLAFSLKIKRPPVLIVRILV